MPNASTHDGNLLTELRRIQPRTRVEVLTRFLRQQIADQLTVELAEVGPRDNLMDLGLSSLRAIELKRLLEMELNLALPSALAFDYPCIDQIAGYLLEQLGLPVTDAPAANPLGHSSAALPPSTNAVDSMDDWSDEQLAQALSNEIAGARAIAGPP